MEDQIKHSYKLCYKFQPVDSRDYKYVAPEQAQGQGQGQEKVKAPVKATPSIFSLRSKMAPILDQGDIGACVSNAYALAISTMTLDKTRVNMSRLMNYAVTRVMTGDSILNDGGLYVRDAAKCISRYGACQESVWPYNVGKFCELPPLTAFQASKLFNNFIYTAVAQDLNSLKTCLTTKQVPIIFGFVVYSSFMTSAVAANGIVPMPNTTKEAVVGGHCTNIVGYDDTKQWFICANSWGTGWGDKGYFYMPYAYITNPNLASDFTYLYF